MDKEKLGYNESIDELYFRLVTNADGLTDE